MTRVKFDREQVLERSTELFWQQGFHASSMQQVFEVTGLKPGSVYLAFGNKAELFKQSLSSYAEKTINMIEQSLSATDKPLEGICNILQGMVDESGDCHYRCCFLIKSQLELSAGDEELKAFITQQTKRIEALYASYIAQEYQSDIAQQYATSLMLHIFGLRVYSYQPNSQQTMLTGLRQGLPWLPWSTQ